MRSDNDCEFCDGCGYILEDKDAYFYYSAEMIRDANRAKTKEEQREKIEQVKKLHGVPMQPHAVTCPKCNGTGKKVRT